MAPKVSSGKCYISNVNSAKQPSDGLKGVTKGMIMERVSVWDKGLERWPSIMSNACG